MSFYNSTFLHHVFVFWLTLFCVFNSLPGPNRPLALAQVWAPAPGHIKLITVVESDKPSNQVLGQKLTITYGPDTDEYESLDEVRLVLVLGSTMRPHWRLCLAPVRIRAISELVLMIFDVYLCFVCVYEPVLSCWHFIFEHRIGGRFWRGSLSR